MSSKKNKHYSNYNSNSNPSYNYNTNSNYNYSSNSNYSYGNNYYSNPKYNYNYNSGCTNTFKNQNLDNGNVIPFGIQNIGNTCFMNSALQCLLSLPSFIKNIDHLISTSNNNDLLKAFKNFIFSEQSSQVKQTVARRNQAFYGFSQQDSFEFATSFIEVISDENPKGIDGLFIGKSKSMVRCKKCFKDENIDQTYSSIILSVNESRRVNYIPFSFKENVIRMYDKPNASENVKVQGGYRINSFRIKDYVLMTKKAQIDKDSQYIIIDQLLPEYSDVYAFELPSKIDNDHCLTVIQTKTDEKQPIISPFLCEVPLGSITEDKLKDIIVDRMKDIISSRKNAKQSLFISIKKPKSLVFNKSETQINNNYSFSIEYVTVYLHENLLNLYNRKELNQEGQVDLAQLFNSHVKQTQLAPPCTWGCDYCKKRSRAYQRVKFSSFPDILLFQIKRSNGEDQNPDKTNVYLPQKISINIGNEFDSIVQNPTESSGVIYELRSISHHSGSFRFGHYWAYGKRGEKWYDFNDSSFHEMDAPREASSSSHMAFYQKVSGNHAGSATTQQHTQSKADTPATSSVGLSQASKPDTTSTASGVDSSQTSKPFSSASGAGSSSISASQASTTNSSTVPKSVVDPSAESGQLEPPTESSQLPAARPGSNDESKSLSTNKPEANAKDIQAYSSNATALTEKPPATGDNAAKDDHAIESNTDHTETGNKQENSTADKRSETTISTAGSSTNQSNKPAESTENATNQSNKPAESTENATNQSNKPAESTENATNQNNKQTNAKTMSGANASSPTTKTGSSSVSRANAPPSSSGLNQNKSSSKDSAATTTGSKGSTVTTTGSKGSAVTTTGSKGSAVTTTGSKGSAAATTRSRGNSSTTTGSRGNTTTTTGSRGRYGNSKGRKNGK